MQYHPFERKNSTIYAVNDFIVIGHTKGRTGQGSGQVLEGSSVSQSDQKGIHAGSKIEQHTRYTYTEYKVLCSGGRGLQCVKLNR